MRVFPGFSLFLWLVASHCLISCSGEVEEPPGEAEEEAEAAQAAVDPFGGDGEATSEPGEDSPAAVAGSGNSDAGLPSALLSPEGLSPEHQKTLNEAIQKAMTKVDLNTLVSAIATNHGIEGLDTSTMTTGVDIRTGTELDPEELKRLGIDPEMLEGLGEEGAQVQGVSVIVLGDPAGIPADLLAGGGEAPEVEVIEETTVETETVEVAADTDPEQGERFQQHLEAGDSDALADEIADLIQQGVDTVTLQQVLGGVSEPTDEP